MKIMPIGSSGAGKSTLTRKLYELTGYPLWHIDQTWHQWDHSELARERLADYQHDFISQHEDWIIDGGYSWLMTERVRTADEIVILEIPRVLALYRVVKRSILNRIFHNRKDLPENFKEKWDREFWEFLKFTWRFPERSAKKQAAVIRAEKAWNKVIVLSNQKEKEAYLARFSAEAKN